VIRIEGKKNLEAAKIGNSDAVQVGDWAIAIGSPFGFQATVTAGIISAKEREVDQSMQFQHFLQTDAAINPGNSGGPLLNIRGEVIGINTAIATQSGGYQGVGFALPINTAAQVYNDIIKNGKVTRGSIGISFVQSNTDQARANLRVAGAKDGGVFVSEVAAGGPSEKAGMKDGDVIVAINGKPIREGSQLIGVVTTTPVGSPLNITVEREGKRENLKVVVGDLAQIFPERFGNPNDPSSKNGDATTVSFGMQIQNLTDRQQESMGLKQKGGVQVVSVEPSSFADDIRLLPGDVIVSINRIPVNTKEDITRIRDTLKPGDAVQFRVMRKNGRNGADWGTNFVAGTLPTNGH
jgi:serine protease Do